LDSGEQPDATMIRSREIFRIRRKTRDDGKVVTFELSTLLDFQGVTLPRRRMNRDFCTRIYRHFDPAADSSLPNSQRFTNDPKVNCPYTGDEMFTREGLPTTDPSKDACSKHVETGCKPRFGENASLPAYLFPGMGLIRPR
jgi:lambda family phage minor tail protein L